MVAKKKGGAPRSAKATATAKTTKPAKEAKAAPVENVVENAASSEIEGVSLPFMKAVVEATAAGSFIYSKAQHHGVPLVNELVLVNFDLSDANDVASFATKATPAGIDYYNKLAPPAAPMWGAAAPVMNNAQGATATGPIVASDKAPRQRHTIPAPVLDVDIPIPEKVRREKSEKSVIDFAALTSPGMSFWYPCDKPHTSEAPNPDDPMKLLSSRVSRANRELAPKAFKLFRVGVDDKRGQGVRLFRMPDVAAEGVTQAPAASSDTWGADTTQPAAPGQAWQS